jgi:acyl dehydratase
VGLNTELAGKSYPESSYEVTAEAIEKYARATNDDNDRYFGDDVVASPVFVVVPAFDSFMASAMDSELGADLLRLVHGAEEHVLHKPVRAGDKLTISPVLEAVDTKESGETFTVKARETNQDGELVAEVIGTMFIRGTGSRRAAGGEADPKEREIVHEETTKVDDDQTYRYAEASGDHNPIHLDENTARMAGLPGIILHGMCTMAIATKAAVNGLAGGDPTKVERVGVRFSRPVLPGQELTTRFWKESGPGGSQTYGFETVNPDGKAVIKNGVVVVAEG